MLQHSQAIEWHGHDQANTPGRRQYRHPALERLVCAAVSNAQLAEVLLCSPALALRKYEVGRSLSDFERRIVLSITGAGDIFDFAGQLHAKVLLSHDREQTQHDDLAHERPALEPTELRLTAAPSVLAP